MLDSPMRLVVSLGLIGGLTVLALQLDAEHVADWCDTIYFPQHLQTINQEFDRTESLNAQDQVILHSIRTKEQLALDVMAGRLSLREAAVQFRAVGQTVHYDWDHYRFTQPTWSEDRRCRQYVIDQVQEILTDRNQEPEALVRKLTQEAEES